MADVVSPAVRSRMMSGIKNSNTKPEILVRREMHRRGFRYKLHSKDLPGKPDIVFQKYRAVIFIHGCLWHRHQCHLFKWPCVDDPQKAEFWRNKINSNSERDARQLADLIERNWRVGVVWECALKGKSKVNVTEVGELLTEWLTSDLRVKEISGVDRVC